jgi:4-carboxymuconolactone decarboxylase
VQSDPERRRLGLETMGKVYGWDVADGPGDFFHYTVEHLFADIWNRPGLTMRDRRLLLLGLLVGDGSFDVLPIQLTAALTNDELDETSARELVVFLAHYAGWPAGARLLTLVEQALAQQAREQQKDSPQQDG